MANKYIFNSPFKSDIQKFLDLKHSLGYKYALEEILLSQFDKMCIFKYPKEKVLTQIIAMDWATARKNESKSSIGNRIVTIREFAKYLNNTGKYAFVIPTTYIPKKKKYQSYIYTNFELKKIFDVIDNKKFNCRYKNCYIAYPVLFRILYCCGLRISEALHLKVKDVDLQNGIIYVYESKNNTDRLVPTGNREIMETNEKIVLTLWENNIDYKGKKINVIRQIIKNKETEKYSKWMWITNREITRKNLYKIIYCAKLRDYIENQGFREQKITSGIDLEHVYSKDIKAIKVIYTIIQITHLMLQIIEHSDICGDFNKKYGSVKVFRRKFYAHLTEQIVNIELIQIKIQIRYDKSLMIY